MHCKSCKNNVDIRMMKAIANNVCPFCGDAIFDGNSKIESVGSFYNVCLEVFGKEALSDGFWAMLDFIFNETFESQYKELIKYRHVYFSLKNDSNFNVSLPEKALPKKQTVEDIEIRNTADKITGSKPRSIKTVGRKRGGGDDDGVEMARNKPQSTGFMVDEAAIAELPSQYHDRARKIKSAAEFRDLIAEIVDSREIEE